MRKIKIDMADELFVIKCNITDSVNAEIEYARKKGKTICYLEDYN